MLSRRAEESSVNLVPFIKTQKDKEGGSQTDILLVMVAIKVEFVPTQPCCLILLITSHRILVFAPSFSSAFTVSMFPIDEAKYSAVREQSSTSLRRAFSFSTINFTTSTRLAAAAVWRGVF